MRLLTALGLTAALLLSALAGAVIVGNATAEESKTYYACADKKTGVLRLVKLKAKCKAGETRVVWGDVTPTPTPTPTPRPIPRSTPAPTVTCDFSQSGTFGTLNDALNLVVISDRCAIPWTGISRVVWSVTAAVDLRPVTESGELVDRVSMYPTIEYFYDDDCRTAFSGCGVGLANLFIVRAAMCADLSACSVTVSNMVSLIAHETGDKVALWLNGIPGRSFSVSGTFTISKE